MIINDILVAKGSGVVTIHGGASLLEAGRKMMEHRIGSLLIVGAEKKVLGIFTERDFMRKVSEYGGKALPLLVSEVMSRNVTVCKTTDVVAEVEAKMSHGKFRHTPVVNEEGELAGMVSAGDITKYNLQAKMREVEQLKQYVGTAG